MTIASNGLPLFECLGLPGYAVTKFGDVYRYHNGGWEKRKLQKDKDGYLELTIRGVHYKVHRLIYEAIIGKIPSSLEVDHINRDRADNDISNIRLCSHKEQWGLKHSS